MYGCDVFLEENRYKGVGVGAVLLIVGIVLILLFFCFASLSASFGYEAAKYAKNAVEVDAVIEKSKERFTVIIDAGHGGEDPGAVVGEIKEKDLNLAVALKLKSFLSLADINVIMTRETDVLLYGEWEERHKKMADLKNRLAIIEQTENCIFVSIHMNKFSDSRLTGLQTFYSENDPKSALLAQSVQSEALLVDPSNHRKIKPENGTIFILENAHKPAILVECGFLSTPSEAVKLTDEGYQNKLAFALYSGIMKYEKENG